MENIKVPFSTQVYDEGSDHVHNVRIEENTLGSKSDRRRFRYILFIGYQDPVGMKLETLPENEESLKKLVTYCIETSTI